MINRDKKSSAEIRRVSAEEDISIATGNRNRPTVARSYELAKEDATKLSYDEKYQILLVQHQRLSVPAPYTISEVDTAYTHSRAADYMFYGLNHPKMKTL